MEVHRVVDWSKIVDYEAVAGVATRIIDVPIRICGIRDIALLCKEQRWTVVVAPV